MFRALFIFLLICSLPILSSCAAQPSDSTFARKSFYYIDDDLAKKTAYLELAARAENGDAKAQLDLGAYQQGRDNAEAVKWFRRSAAQGNPAAHYRMGVMYSYGWGVEKDEKESDKWFHRAAELGDEDAILHFADKFADAGDYKSTMEWCLKAPQNLRSMFMIGIMHYKGLGVEKDFKEAFKWFLKGAEKGDCDAMAYLARMYDQGMGVDKNAVESKKWRYKTENAPCTSGPFLCFPTGPFH